MKSSQSKVVVILTEEEHAKLKEITSESRRSLGQELAFRAFQAIRSTRKTAPRRKTKEAA